MIPVLVTTVHRGVFFGYVGSLDQVQGDTIRLENARNCLYWSSNVRGFLGLAANGPTNDCRVGPRANITLRNVTAVAEVTVEAAQRWEEAPWAR